MKLIVGLGNPGQKYRGTRHNVGYEVIAELASRWPPGRPKQKFNAELLEGSIANQKVMLVSPLTFMNLSGNSVQPLADFYKIDATEILVVCDDLNLDCGRLRLRPSGSAGGQNGLKDIIQRIGTQAFPRLRVGIGRPPAGWDAADYVLGKVDDEQRVVIDGCVRRAADACEAWVRDGVQLTMTKFNADPNAAKKEKTKREPESDAKPD